MHDIKLNPTAVNVLVPRAKGDFLPKHPPLSQSERQHPENNLTPFCPLHVAAHLDKICSLKENLMEKETKSKRFKRNALPSDLVYKAHWLVDGLSIYMHWKGLLWEPTPESCMISIKIPATDNFSEFVLKSYRCFGKYSYHVLDGAIFEFHRCVDSLVPGITAHDIIYNPDVHVTKIITARPESVEKLYCWAFATGYQGVGPHSTSTYSSYKDMEVRIADDDPARIPRPFLTRIEDRLKGRKIIEERGGLRPPPDKSEKKGFREAPNPGCIMDFDRQRNVNPFQRLKQRKLDMALLSNPTNNKGWVEAWAFMALRDRYGVREAVRRMNKATDGNFSRDTRTLFGKPSLDLNALWQNRMARFLGDIPVERQVRNVMRKNGYQHSKLSISMKELKKMYPQTEISDNDA